MVTYETNVDSLSATDLDGFFVGWPTPPSGDALASILRGSTYAVIARDGDAVVGFINALSDGVLSVFIPLIEVRPTHQGRGIGQELVRQMLARVHDVYAVDLVCDDALVPFYEKVGGTRLAGIGWRNREALP